jgi:hypothetical protein
MYARLSGLRNQSIGGWARHISAELTECYSVGLFKSILSLMNSGFRPEFFHLFAEGYASSLHSHILLEVSLNRVAAAINFRLERRS